MYIVGVNIYVFAIIIIIISQWVMTDARHDSTANVTQHSCLFVWQVGCQSDGLFMAILL